MSQAITRRAESPRSQTPPSARHAISRIGLLQVVIIVLAIVTALVHLDKALMLGFPFGHPAGLPLGAPSGGHAPAPGGASGGAHGAAPGGARGGRPSGPGLALPLPLPVLFFLNFLGYIVLIAALYLPLPFLQRYHAVIRWLLIAFAVVTILGYFAIVGEAPNALGAFDKAVELALIVFLLIDAYYAHVSRRA